MQTVAKSRSSRANVTWAATVCAWLLFATLSLSLAQAFDLNALPEEQDDEPSQMSVLQAPKAVPAQPRRSPSKQQQQPKITPQFYAKVNKLFKTLAVCDTDSFDLSAIEIPESFSAENKAIMALKKVAKANLIKRADKPRFKRMMDNCGQLAEAVQARIESSMSVESQMSGGSYEDNMDRLRSSPLDSFRDRFVTNRQQQQQTPKSQQRSRSMNQRDQPQQVQRPIARAQSLQNTADQGAGTGFIQFL